MKKKLSIVIMAHPERKEWAEELSRKLKAPIVYDRKNNVWDTCRRSWLAVDKNAEYGLVLQDDSIIADNFIEKAESLLIEDYVYSFFAGRLLSSRINRAITKKENFVITQMIFNEVALCMKTTHIKDMVKFCDDLGAKTDQYIARWAKLRKIEINYPLPSIVDHRDGESIYYRNYKLPAFNRPRKAFMFKKK